MTVSHIIDIRRLGPQTAIAPLRPEGWAQDAGQVVALRDALDARLDGRSRAAADIPGLALAAAVLRGGLWRPAAWVALANQIQSGGWRPAVATRFPNLAFIELKLSLPRQDQAHSNLAPGREMLRWFPDVVSLHLIDRWSRLDVSAPTLKSPQAALRLMQAALRVQSRLTPKALSRAAIAALEARSGVAVPMVLATTASGETPALSVNSAHWRALCAGQRGDAGGSWQGPPPASQDSARRAATHAPPVKTDDAALRALLARYASNSTRRGTRPLKEGLRQIAAAPGASPALSALASWYLALLEAGDKPRTITNYHAIAGKHLLTVMAGDDPCAMAPETLGLRAGQALDLSRYDNRGHPAGRIAHFLRHAQMHCGWPKADLADLIASGGSGPAMIATAVLPWGCYPAIYDHLRRATDLPRATAQTEALAFAMMAWGGLRLSEAMGRSLADLSDDLTVHVHCTATHGLKSDAARRLLPLGLFLPDRIARDLRRYRDRQMATCADPRQVPLFDATGLLPEDRLDPARLGQRLQALTRAMLGVACSPHALRHSWASAIQLLLTLGNAGTDTISALTGWNGSKQRDLRLHLLGLSGSPARAPQVLAGMIGHRELSPVTTLSYCHLADLGLGRLIMAAPERVAADRAARMLGLNRRSLHRHIGQDGQVRLEDLRHTVLDRLQPQIIAANPMPSCVPSPRDSAPLGPEQVMAVLLAAGNGRTPPDLALMFDQPESEMQRLLSCARTLMDQPTQKRGPRLRNPEQAGLFLPPMRYSAANEAMMRHILQQAMEFDMGTRRVWTAPFLRSGDRHRGQILFHHPTALSDWLAACPLPSLKAQLVVTVIAPAGQLDHCARHWRIGSGWDGRLVMRDSAKASMNSPYGRAALSLHSVTDGKGSNVTLQALRRAAFVIAVRDGLVRC